ncbi:MAG: hypothetical protein ACKVX7_12160 [Planctomycetota bacterium]
MVGSKRLAAVLWMMIVVGGTIFAREARAGGVGGFGVGHLLDILDAVGAPGATVTVPIQYVNGSSSVTDGWSFGVAHDSNALQIESVSLGADGATMKGGTGPDFHSTTIYPGQGFTVGVVISFLGGASLGAGIYEIEEATYTVLMSDGESSQLCFNSTFGFPVVVAVVIDGGTSITPVTSCGLVQCEAPEGFVRGDFDDSGALAASDLAQLYDYLWPGAAGAGPEENPVDCSGDVEPDVADVNDNEWLTLADWILLRKSLAGSATVPEPTACGVDPDDDTQGFEFNDGLYRIRISGVDILGTDPTETRQVFFSFQLDLLPGAPPVSGFTVALEFNPDVLHVPASSAWLGLGTGVHIQAGNKLILSRWTTNVTSAPFAVDVGSLLLELPPFAVFAPLEWLPEVSVTTAGGRVVNYRATVVDVFGNDHHPEMTNGEYEFVRGNSNSDAAVNIADSIHILQYLFNGGPAAACPDAADANNDSQIDIADAISVLYYLFSGGPILPHPYPQCGFDDGQIDRLGCALLPDVCAE